MKNKVSKEKEIKVTVIPIVPKTVIKVIKVKVLVQMEIVVIRINNKKLLERKLKKLKWIQKTKLILIKVRVIYQKKVIYQVLKVQKHSKNIPSLSDLK